MGFGPFPRLLGEPSLAPTEVVVRARPLSKKEAGGQEVGPERGPRDPTGVRRDSAR